MTEPRDTETPATQGASPDPGRQEVSGAAVGHSTPTEDRSSLSGASDSTDSTDSTDPADSADSAHAAVPATPLSHGPRYTDATPPEAHDEATATQPPAPAAPVGTRLQRRQQAERRRGRTSFFAELPVLLLVAFVLALLLKTFLVQAFYIPSESMVPTLAVGDRVLVNKLAHDFRDPERGEVIVFSQEDGLPGADPSDNPIMRTFQSLASGLGFVQTGEKDFIKRIIGLPGETIEMREGVVYIDEVAIPEQAQEEGGYLSRPDMVDFGPVDIPEGEYFLMGDNRPNSSDSRSMLSTIAEEDIIGRAFAVVWPLNRFSVLSMPDYEGLLEVTDAREPGVLVGGRARR